VIVDIFTSRKNFYCALMAS